ncbi:MAG: hypothetical protein M3Y21_06415 [Candidatus Eremiobacteraeota bacterium]|nr:hypothetical protein [Candidatus Eremiobacteraeota bacterium]
MIFPLGAAALTLTLNGAIVRSYDPPYLLRGHVVAPVMPFLTRVATRVAYANGRLLLWREGHVARIRIAPDQAIALQSAYVEIAPILRALGESVSFDGAHHVLTVRTPPSPPIHLPSPFDPQIPQVLPTVIFTPTPPVTPKPIFTGVPRPRRTPIPLQTPSSGQ